jgi:hypothetical protein
MIGIEICFVNVIKSHSVMWTLKWNKHISQDRQCMCNITLGHVCAPVGAVEKQ